MGRARRLRVGSLPQKLKQIREALKLSQNELIRQLGFEEAIYQGNVSEYESGFREPLLPILLFQHASKSYAISLQEFIMLSFLGLKRKNRANFICVPILKPMHFQCIVV